MAMSIIANTWQVFYVPASTLPALNIKISMLVKMQSNCITGKNQVAYMNSLGNFSVS